MTLSAKGVVFFVQYVLLFVALAVLVKWSQTPSGKYSYNTTLVVFVVELVKFFAAISMFVCSSSVGDFIHAVKSNLKLLLLYFVPAVLYALHNNLMFISMTYLDPATYTVLMQFRVIVTALLFQFIFRRTLSRLQWLALIILFAGCLLKELDRNMDLKRSTEKNHNNLVIFVVLFQVLFSCGAAVYTEYLLKSSEQANVHLQNVFMYADSLVCNCGVLIVRGLFSRAIISGDDFLSLLQPKVLAVIGVSAAGGLTTAFLLKYLDSVLKVYANSFEIMLAAIASYFLLGVKISALSYVALITVCVSLALYKRGAPKITKSKENGECPTTKV